MSYLHFGLLGQVSFWAPPSFDRSKSSILNAATVGGIGRGKGSLDAMSLDFSRNAGDSLMKADCSLRDEATARVSIVPAAADLDARGVSSAWDCVWLVAEATHRPALLRVSLGVEPCAVCLRKVACVAYVVGDEMGLWGEDDDYNDRD
jgi:hypothetical protein